MKGRCENRLKETLCKKCGIVIFAKRNDAQCAECRRKQKCECAAKFRRDFPDLAKNKLAEWRKKNSTKTNDYAKQYRESHKAQRSAYQQYRESYKNSQCPSWSNLDHIAGMYELCGIFRNIGLDLHVDHIIPLKGKLVSGLHIENNLQLLHRSENLRKLNLFEVNA